MKERPKKNETSDEDGGKGTLEKRTKGNGVHFD